MKKIISVFASLLVLICFFSCSNPSVPVSVPLHVEETYTVYTTSIPYSEFRTIFGVELEDGIYYRSPLEEDILEEAISNDPAEAKKYQHQWMRSQIKDWFIGHYFSKDVAERETSWLVTIDHGIIFSRTRSMVYCILK